MKAYKKLLVMFLMGATAVLNVGCGGDDDEVLNPTLTVNADKTSAAPGETVKLDIGASTTETLKNIKIEEVITGTSQLAELKDSSISGKNFVYVYNYVVPAGATGTKDIKVTVSDNGNRVSTKTVKITVSGTAAVNTYSARMLGAQSAQTGSFYATGTNEIFTVTQAKSNQGKVDFVYYYGTDNKATVAAPNDAGAAEFNVFDLANWSTKNATMFKKTNAAAFDANTTAALQTAYDDASGTGGSSATQLSVGDVVAFKTQAGKYGVFKVAGLTANNDGAITIDVKVQP